MCKVFLSKSYIIFYFVHQLISWPNFFINEVTVAIFVTNSRCHIELNGLTLKLLLKLLLPYIPLRG